VRQETATSKHIAADGRLLHKRHGWPGSSLWESWLRFSTHIPLPEGCTNHY